MLQFRTACHVAVRRGLSFSPSAVTALALVCLTTLGLAAPVESNSAPRAAKAGSPAPGWTAAQNIPPEAPSGGAWRLVRTPGPRESGDVVSIMRTADALDSDPDFAGIMIRCRPRAALQIAFVMVTPFPLKARPRITVAVNGTTTGFDGAVIPPGSMLSLPDQASVLAQGVWQSAGKLSIEIEHDGGLIKGNVPLSGLTKAMGELQSSCATQ